jgi:hypothetical protein
MSKTYYDLLDVAPSAPIDEIKRAFRREIAKYHPDKVAHLGKEFQEIAAVKAAELTEAYTVLGDETLRAEYDELIASGGAPVAAPVHEPAAPAPPPHQQEPPASAPPRHVEPPPPPGSSVFQHERSASSDLVLRVARERFKAALASEFGQYEDLKIQGFEVCAVPKGAFFSMKVPPRVFGRMVPVVNAAAVTEAWGLATRGPKDTKPRDTCLFLMGPDVAPPGELAAAINAERRRPIPGGGKMFVVPVNTRTWAAHIPADAPPVVKSLLSRLKNA